MKTTHKFKVVTKKLAPPSKKMLSIGGKKWLDMLWKIMYIQYNSNLKTLDTETILYNKEKR